MENDKHYFVVGLFIVGLFVAAAFFAFWIENSGHHDDVRYRIHFQDSVSGLSVGDPVKYRGVDVGSVDKISIDPDDIRLVRVDVKLRKKTPVNTDTKASLRLKGITGVVFVELAGDDPAAPSLVSVTPKGQVPEIPAEPSSLNAVMDQLPKTLKKVDTIAGQIEKLVSDKNINAMSDTIHNADELSASLKEHPSQLIWGKKKDSGKDENKRDQDETDETIPDHRTHD